MCCRIRKKLVIIGDEGCGKTCLLTVSSQGQFPESPGGGLGSVHNIDLKVDRRKFRLISWDTKGSSDYERIRPLSYPQSDVFLLCFPIDSPRSLRNVQKWVEEVQHFCPTVPIVLVGTKKDLQVDKQVSEDGHATAKSIGAYAYVECSAKQNEGVREVFEAAARAAF